MLRWRLILGVLIISLLAALCWWDMTLATAGAVMFPVALVLSLLATDELLKMFATQKHQPLRKLVYLGNLLIVGSNALVVYWDDYPVDCPIGKLGWPILMLAVAMIGLFMGEIYRYKAPGSVIMNLSLGLFSFAYVSVPFSFLIHLRLFGASSMGMLAILSVIIIVKMCDTGAYTVGRLLGKKFPVKMAPVLSPGKTMVGLLGGIAFGVLGSWITFYLIAPRWFGNFAGLENSWGWIVYGVVIAMMGVLGDLSESLIKRDMQCKDSSTWMPGFGGVLDIVDSILLATPVAYLCWSVDMVGILPGIVKF